MHGRRKLSIISVGGTIAMTGGGRDGVAPVLSADDLAAGVPGLSEVADIHPYSFLNQASNRMTLAQVEDLAALIDEQARSGMDGAIVTHGTDTIEEVAFALDLMPRPPIPVVITGAMRNPTLVGADGPLNLYNAALVACTNWAARLGVTVVFDDEIHAAREVRKLHTTRMDAFASEFGLAGSIGEDGPSRHRDLTPLPKIPPPTRADWPGVGLLDAVLDDDGTAARALTGNGFEGLVVNGLGGGHVSPAAADVLGTVAPHIPVVMASRTRGGTVLARTYGYEGGEIDLARRGVIRAGWLDGYKARVALILLLRGGADRNAIQQFFNYFDGG